VDVASSNQWSATGYLLDESCSSGEFGRPILSTHASSLIVRTIRSKDHTLAACGRERASPRLAGIHGSVRIISRNISAAYPPNYMLHNLFPRLNQNETENIPSHAGKTRFALSALIRANLPNQPSFSQLIGRVRIMTRRAGPQAPAGLLREFVAGRPCVPNMGQSSWQGRAGETAVEFRELDVTIFWRCTLLRYFPG